MFLNSLKMDYYIRKQEHLIMLGSLDEIINKINKNFISPEIWQDKPYDLKSDIWSLGDFIKS